MGAHSRQQSRHPNLLSVGSTAVFVVDIQERFRNYVADFDGLVAATRLLVRACERLGVPVVYSEQYPQGLGETVEELAADLAGASKFEKLAISSACASGFAGATAHLPDGVTWLVAGIETHVCVNQTVHDLLHQGHRVHVCADAVGSHDPRQRELALERLAAAGATITSVEMALFELLGRAGTPEFKDVQGLIKEHARAREGAMA